MLLMPTLKFGDPIQIFVQVKTDNFSGLTLKLALRLHGVLTFWPEDSILVQIASGDEKNRSPPTFGDAERTQLDPGLAVRYRADDRSGRWDAQQG
jgi:hypothetical protein